MTIRLEDLQRCFQGVAPAIICTCARDGTPNVTYLSQVYYVDPRHVALSRQFFNKTTKNIDENPQACVQVYDPLSFESYRLRLRFLRSETSGPLFDTMALRIQMIASHTGMAGIFRLISSDVYEVDAIEEVQGFLARAAADDDAAVDRDDGPLTELRGLQLVSDRLRSARDLEGLLAATLAALEEIFGFGHSMVLLPADSGERLVTTASRGYGHEGIGAEVRVGDGCIGLVARERRLVRFSDVRAEISYGRAVRGRVAATGCAALEPEIPLPGLPDAQSHMAIPLVAQDRLVGVIAVESRDPLAFDEWDEAFLSIIANQIAAVLDRMLADEDDGDEAPEAGALAVPPTAPERTFVYYRNDDCVFLDGEYLIRNVPAKILWKLLTAWRRDRRTDFCNRELRLDPTLGLPALRDNLESRLILLRKRLVEKCPDIRLVPRRRGVFGLEVSCQVKLIERDTA
jgi:uncharacterized protein YigA (DUF484 family)